MPGFGANHLDLRQGDCRTRGPFAGLESHFSPNDALLPGSLFPRLQHSQLNAGNRCHLVMEAAIRRVAEVTGYLSSMDVRWEDECRDC